MLVMRGAHEVAPDLVEFGLLYGSLLLGADDETDDGMRLSLDI